MGIRENESFKIIIDRMRNGSDGTPSAKFQIAVMEACAEAVKTEDEEAAYFAMKVCEVMRDETYDLQTAHF